jgi:hypothetical protein
MLNLAQPRLHLPNFPFAMKSLPALAAATCLLALGAGCLFPKSFSKDKVKPNPHISSELEKQFEQRWEEKRVSDLVATGMGAAAAQAQASQEYHAKYIYAQPVARP